MHPQYPTDPPAAKLAHSRGYTLANLCSRVLAIVSAVREAGVPVAGVVGLIQLATAAFGPLLRVKDNPFTELSSLETYLLRYHRPVSFYKQYIAMISAVADVVADAVVNVTVGGSVTMPRWLMRLSAKMYGVIGYAYSSLISCGGEPHHHLPIAALTPWLTTDDKLSAVMQAWMDCDAVNNSSDDAELILDALKRAGICDVKLAILRDPDAARDTGRGPPRDVFLRLIGHIATLARRHISCCDVTTDCLTLLRMLWTPSASSHMFVLLVGNHDVWTLMTDAIQLFPDREDVAEAVMLLRAKLRAYLDNVVAEMLPPAAEAAAANVAGDDGNDDDDVV